MLSSASAYIKHALPCHAIAHWSGARDTHGLAQPSHFDFDFWFRGAHPLPLPSFLPTGQLCTVPRRTALHWRIGVDLITRVAICNRFLSIPWLTYMPRTAALDLWYLLVDCFVSSFNFFLLLVFLDTSYLYLIEWIMSCGWLLVVSSQFHGFELCNEWSSVIFKLIVCLFASVYNLSVMKWYLHLLVVHTSSRFHGQQS